MVVSPQPWTTYSYGWSLKTAEVDIVTVYNFIVKMLDAAVRPIAECR